MFKQIDIPTMMEEARQRRNRQLILSFVLVWIVLFLAIVLGAGVHAQEATTPVPPAPPPPAAVQTPDDFVAQLGNDKFGWCSSFFVAPNLIITAGHCVVDQPLDNLKVDPSGTKALYQVTLAALSDLRQGLDDFAILRLAKGFPADWKPGVLDCAYVAHLGDELTFVGYPQANFGKTFGKGYVNGALRAAAGWKFPLIPLTTPVAGGASGSPVMHDGKIIGILVGTNPEQPGWSYVQPIGVVCAMLHLS